jgi:hypothetical protein
MIQKLDVIPQLLLVDLQKGAAKYAAVAFEGLWELFCLEGVDCEDLGAENRKEAVKLGAINLIIVAMCKWGKHHDVQNSV